MKEVIVKCGVSTRYSVFTSGGGFIFNANSMKEIRDWYRWELRHGLISIRKELNNDKRGTIGASGRFAYGTAGRSVRL